MQTHLFRSLAFAVSASLLLGGLSATDAPGQDATGPAVPQTLRAMIMQAEPGGHITLAPGHYGTLTLRDLQFPAGVPLIIQSADPAQPARFSGLTLKDVSNLVFQDVVFDYVFQPGNAPHLRPFAITDSQGVTISRAVFDGDTARDAGDTGDGYGSGYGLSIDRSSDILLQDSRLYGFLRGVVVNDSHNVTVQDNELYDLRSDGLNFAQVTDVAILRNHIHDFLPLHTSTDHADMIQFWTKGTTAPSRNVTIADNVLNAGTGRYTQSLFMRNDMVDRGLAGYEMFYENISITGNVIINAHRHGITVGETQGLIINNNTVVHNTSASGQPPEQSVWIPLINVSATSRHVSIAGNVTGGITGATGQPDWNVGTNLLVQNKERMKPGFYGQVFGPQALYDQTRTESFAPRPGGMLDGTGIGSQLLSAGR